MHLFAERPPSHRAPVPRWHLVPSRRCLIIFGHLCKDGAGLVAPGSLAAAKRKNSNSKFTAGWLAPPKRGLEEAQAKEAGPIQAARSSRRKGFRRRAQEAGAVRTATENQEEVVDTEAKRQEGHSLLFQASTCQGPRACQKGAAAHSKGPAPMVCGSFAAGRARRNSPRRWTPSGDTLL